MTFRDEVERARTFLFVPGNRPDRFAKAQRSGADVIILDLEDAVDPADKQLARENVARYVRTNSSCVVRLNAAGTTWHESDLDAFRQCGCVFMLPRSEDLVTLRSVGLAAGPGGGVVALIETALGVQMASEIAAAPGVLRLAIGTFDLGLDIGVDPDCHQALAFARGALVIASRAAGLPAPVDGVTGSFTDAELVAIEAARAKRWGYGGKMCIHPDQIDPVHRGFQPTTEEVIWARSVLAASDDMGASQLNGAMIDAPVIKRAEAILNEH